MRGTDIQCIINAICNINRSQWVKDVKYNIDNNTLIIIYKNGTEKILKLKDTEVGITEDVVKDVEYSVEHNILTITYTDGVLKDIELPEDNFLSDAKYDHNTFTLILTLNDGTKLNVDLKELMGTTPSLQEVTDVGNTTTNEIIVQGTNQAFPVHQTTIGKDFIKIVDSSDTPIVTAGILPTKLYMNMFYMESLKDSVNIKSELAKNLNLFNGDKQISRVTSTGKILYSNVFDTQLTGESSLLSSAINIHHDSYNTTVKNPILLSFRTLYDVETVTPVVGDPVLKELITTFRVCIPTVLNGYMSNADKGDICLLKSGDGAKVMIGTNARSQPGTELYNKYVMLQPNQVLGHYGLSVKSVSYTDTYTGIGVKDPRKALEINSKTKGDVGVIYTQVNASTPSYTGTHKLFGVDGIGNQVVVDATSVSPEPKKQDLQSVLEVGNITDLDINIDKGGEYASIHSSTGSSFYDKGKSDVLTMGALGMYYGSDDYLTPYVRINRGMFLFLNTFDFVSSAEVKFTGLVDVANDSNYNRQVWISPQGTIGYKPELQSELSIIYTTAQF